MEDLKKIKYILMIKESLILSEIGFQHLNRLSLFERDKLLRSITQGIVAPPRHVLQDVVGRVEDMSSHGG